MTASLTFARESSMKREMLAQLMQRMHLRHVTMSPGHDGGATDPDVAGQLRQNCDVQ